MPAPNALPSATEVRLEPLTPADLAGFWSTRIQPWVYDFDYLGHLTAAVYPKAFEQGRVEYFRERWAVDMPRYVVAHHQMHYMKEIKEQDGKQISVLIRPVEVGESSIRLEELLLDAHERIANISTVTLVAWDIDKRGSRRLDDHERSALDTDLARLGGLTSRTV